MLSSSCSLIIVDPLLPTDQCSLTNLDHFVVELIRDQINATKTCCALYLILCVETAGAVFLVALMRQRTLANFFVIVVEL